METGRISMNTYGLPVCPNCGHFVCACPVSAHDKYGYTVNHPPEPLSEEQVRRIVREELDRAIDKALGYEPVGTDRPELRAKHLVLRTEYKPLPVEAPSDWSEEFMTNLKDQA